MTVADAQIRKLMDEMNKHGKISKASMKANIDRKTGAKYHSLNKLPSELPPPVRRHLTHKDIFEDIWPEVECKLNLAHNLQAKSLFKWFQKQYPEKFQDSKLRTFQRRVKKWRGTMGPEKEIFFAQEHRPGEAMQLDFTHCNCLNITIDGVFFEHMLCHIVLPYSNWEWASVCKSESLVALRNGLQDSLFKLGYHPIKLQTDSLSAATHDLGGGARDFNVSYKEVVSHFNMTPKKIGIRKCNQNGDVESSHNALKNCLEQQLILRESRDFNSVAEYETWVRVIMNENNTYRSEKLAEELSVMQKVTSPKLKRYREYKVKVSRESTVSILKNTYSVPSRLIGETLNIRVYDSSLEIYYGSVLQMRTERLLGSKKSRINYRHVISSLIQKPGAFARFRYQKEMFPGIEFREAYDSLHSHFSSEYKADFEYLRILNKAAFNSEEDVRKCLSLLLEEKITPEFDTVCALLTPLDQQIPELKHLDASLSEYDELMEQPEMLQGSTHG